MAPALSRFEKRDPRLVPALSLALLSATGQPVDPLLNRLTTADHAPMRTDDFVALHPRLFHMTSAEAWPQIERHGLRSVTALLDLLYYDPGRRAAIEAQRRPDILVLSDSEFGRFEIRDQKPLSIEKLERPA